MTTQTARMRGRCRNFHTTFGTGIALVVVLVANSLLCGGAIPYSTPQEGDVCGDPATKCQTSFAFEKNDLPFVINGEVQFKEYQSAFFHAVVLKSVKAAAGDNCSFVPETERLEVQRLFPKNKVFTSRVGCPESQILYDGVNQDYNFLAVYGGTTRADAEKVLHQVKSRYPDANIRRMRVIRGIT